MNVLGVRCSNSDFAYAVLTGTRGAPVLLASDLVAYPKGFARPQSLRWLLQEAETILKTHPVAVIVMRKHEGPVKGNLYEERVEHEAAISIAAAMCGVKAVKKKAGSTMAKDMGFKGRAHYLRDSLDTSPLVGYDALDSKAKEAAVAAWSGLPDGT